MVLVAKQIIAHSRNVVYSVIYLSEIEVEVEPNLQYPSSPQIRVIFSHYLYSGLVRANKDKTRLP